MNEQSPHQPEEMDRRGFLKKLLGWGGLVVASSIPGVARAQEQPRPSPERKESESLPSHGRIAFFVTPGRIDGESVKLALHDLNGNTLKERRQAQTMPLSREDFLELRLGSPELQSVKLGFDGDQLLLSTGDKDTFGSFSATMPEKSDHLTLKDSVTGPAYHPDDDRREQAAREALTKELAQTGMAVHVVHRFNGDHVLLIHQLEHNDPPEERHAGYRFYEVNRSEGRWHWKLVSPRFEGYFVPGSPIAYKKPPEPSLG